MENHCWKRVVTLYSCTVWQVASPYVFVFCDSSVAATWSLFAVLFRIILSTSNKFHVALCSSHTRWRCWKYTFFLHCGPLNCAAAVCLFDDYGKCTCRLRFNVFHCDVENEYKLLLKLSPLWRFLWPTTFLCLYSVMYTVSQETSHLYNLL